MIINLRGTSGSGKSTVVRRLFDLYNPRQPYFIDGRKRPLGYVCTRKDSDGPSLVALGHYETPCGGCDTIPTIDMVYEQIRAQVALGHDVIYEGLLIQSDVKRCAQLHKDGLPLLVIGLDTPLADCLAGVQARRDARGDVRPLNPANTISKLNSLPGQMRRLKAEGVDFRLLNREAAFAACCGALNLGIWAGCGQSREERNDVCGA